MVMGSLSQQTDVVVIGGGPGGYVAALRAADLGREVILVEERPRRGGVCLLEGCIPSKTLIHSVEIAEAARHGKSFGVVCGEVSIDAGALRTHKEKVVTVLSRGVDQLLKARGVEVIQARARFEGPRKLQLAGADVAGIEFRHAIVATGSSIVRLPMMEGLDLWTSREALEVGEIPTSLLVIGGGYIGLELGFVYAGLGSKVSVVEMLPSLLTGADKDLVRPVAKSAKSAFEEVMLEARVTGIEKVGSGGFKVTIEAKGKTLERTFDQVLVAVGRKPNTGDLGLEHTGVKVDEQGWIEIDDQCRTAEPSIYAIGDVTPGPMLAHKASRQGKVAAEALAGHSAAFDNRAIPAVVFTRPEVAWAGLTEDQAREEGRPVKVGRFPLAALGRARTLGGPDGAFKVISDPDSGLLLGVGMVGPHASELVAEGALAIEMGATLEDLAATIHPHPTLSEGLCEAAEVALGAAIHITSR
ncbi:MAG: dihydrolipoyl dehydrogenase [Acidobacteriota bacterium]|nr:dihydrolipoyl dehydrogenase [Acidobacteriota bacterium]